ncbi:MAG: UDP-4-amino-4,6-dideoxy-N-acetyl-beta-L-altrosamine transaminase, partial [Candidatus Eremiobacteraeota bacterium]|nr:UDP-4-amino-4,6-dideoxy-N-acetyl-beta-L-altrosamine transaminase [Candidatus Eremiobacteraeota bacterium]
DLEAVRQVLRSDFLTQGPQIEAFERAVAEFCGAPHAVAFCNATAALHVGCLSLGVGPGDLVWTSPISFVASANCARYCGADVDFVDVDARTYNMSAAALERKLETARKAGRLPKVVVTVDFGGQPGELQAIAALRERFGFKIIEDASHAIGASYKGKRIGDGALADVTVFSFHPVKIVTTGEGGMALTADPETARRLRLLRSHGVTRDPAWMAEGPHEPWEYEQIDLGFNYRLTDIAAALGIAQLGRIEEFLKRRREIAAIYDAGLSGLAVTVPWQHPDTQSAYHLYVVRIRPDAQRSRRQVYDGLLSRGIAPNVHYMPIHLQPYYRKQGFAAGMFPQAEAYYREALSLPMYPGLTAPQQQQVIAALGESLQS